MIFSDVVHLTNQIILGSISHVLRVLAEPILGRDAKRRALQRAVAEMGISLADTLAVGDGANDVGMIEAAGLGVGYHPKPILAQAANAIIMHSDLTALLYLQGYREDEIVAR